MCGISGFFAFDQLDGGQCIQMNPLIRHRGPDDEGYAFFADAQTLPSVCGGADTPPQAWNVGTAYAPREHVGAFIPARHRAMLAHRRLSIVDLSPAGHQPMCTPDQRYWIVYNGEVYNHLELRVELEALGHVFHSHSDTEVILAAYRQWGGACLERFNGMFAILIYDREAQVLFAARDRFGVKPLYYWVSPQGVAFASEIKQFTVLPGWQARMNGQRVYDFLNWGVTDHTDETLFREVFQLRGGERLEMPLEQLNRVRAGGRLPSQVWYRLASHEVDGSFESASRQFAELLEDSVRLRLRADVPVGSCLSGGLDSSAIVCLMNRLLAGHDVHALQQTFSACARVKRFDEKEYVDEVVRATGVKAHYVYPEPDELFDLNEKITWHQDEPFGSTSIYAQWHVFRLAAQNDVKVMLDGQGADEQLAGYHGFFAPRFAGLFRRLRWLTLWREIRATKKLHGYPGSYALKQMANALLPEPLRQLLRKKAGKASSAPEWINMSVLGAVPLDPFAKQGAKADTIRALSRAQLTATNLQMLLHWEDRDSMAHSIESRVPFLDYRLVEFVVGLPDEYKLSDGMTKRVLREGMKGILPERIRLRMDKLGFVTPEEVWVKEVATDRFRNAVKSAIDGSQGVLNGKALEIFEEMAAGKRPFSFYIWRVISYGAWIKRFKVQL